MPDHNLQIKWRTVAVSSLIVVGALAVLLAVVASIRDVDVLSTIALGLAVIAFVVQIVVYIAQADSASRQQIQAAEINSRTIAALSTIEEKAEGTRSTVDRLHDRLLEAALRKAVPEAVATEATPGSEEFNETVSRMVRDIITSADSANVPIQQQTPQERVSTEDPTMLVLPNDEQLTAAVTAMKGLTGSQLSSLRRLARDQAATGGGDHSSIGPGLRTVNPYVVKELFDRGLIVRRKVRWVSAPVFQLTDLGKDAGRVLLAKDISRASEEAKKIRDDVANYEASLRREARNPPAYKDIPLEE